MGMPSTRNAAEQIQLGEELSQDALPYISPPQLCTSTPPNMKGNSAECDGTAVHPGVRS